MPILKSKLCFLVCLIVGGGAEALLIHRLDIGIIDALLLCLFGTGCAGACLLGLGLFGNKHQEE